MTILEKRNKFLNYLNISELDDIFLETNFDYDFYINTLEGRISKVEYLNELSQINNIFRYNYLKTMVLLRVADIYNFKKIEIIDEMTGQYRSYKLDNIVANIQKRISITDFFYSQIFNKYLNVGKKYFYKDTHNKYLRKKIKILTRVIIIFLKHFKKIIEDRYEPPNGKGYLECLESFNKNVDSNFL